MVDIQKSLEEPGAQPEEGQSDDYDGLTPTDTATLGHLYSEGPTTESDVWELANEQMDAMGKSYDE